MTGANLTKLSSGHRFIGLKFESAILNNANFSGVNLSFSNFKNAKLKNANFRNANLEHARFTSADLTGADLTGARVDNIVLIGTRLCKTKTPWGEDNSGCGKNIMELLLLPH